MRFYDTGTTGLTASKEQILIVYHSNTPDVSKFDCADSAVSAMYDSWCFKINYNFTSKLWKQPLISINRKQTLTHTFCIFCSHHKTWSLSTTKTQIYLQENESLITIFKSKLIKQECY